MATKTTGMDLTPERWARLDQAVQAAMAMSAASRHDFLDRQLASDPALRAEAEIYLRDQDGAATDGDLRAVVHEATLEIGEPTRAGPYEIVRKLGEGGMGAVYLARRDDAEFRQDVALKLVRHDAAHPLLLQRFKQERQILAGLNHPHIARIFDGGGSADGRPYFVMEYVDGAPLAEFAAGLKLDAKLALFRQICSAVQYAHRKLIVHRDLKPANILVTRDGQAKLLDFGIAKLLDPLEAGETLTATGVRAMTPEYASPEQVRGEETTTATDVYALGAILYELLTGGRAHRFEKRTESEMARVICEAMPPAPGVDADLDNIVLMAMRKEPERRYASVEQLDADIQRYLERRPVMARPDTWRYRASKFARRNRGGVIAAALLAVTLVTGVGTTVWQARRAERRFKETRELANRFLFDFHDEIRSLPGSTKARAMVVRTALEYLDRLSKDAAGDPGLSLELVTAYEKVAMAQGLPWQANLGRYKDAAASYDKASSIAEGLLNGDPRNDSVRRTLGRLHVRRSQLASFLGDQDAAKKASDRALAVSDPLSLASNPAAADLELIAMIRTARGDVLFNAGRPAAALPDFEKGLELRLRAASIAPGAVAWRGAGASHERVGNALHRLGRIEEAVRSFEAERDTESRALASDPANVLYKSSLALAFEHLGDAYAGADRPNLGDPAKGLEAYAKSHALVREMAAADSANTQASAAMVRALERLASVRQMTDPLAAADYYRQALEVVDRLPAGLERDFARFVETINLAQPLTEMRDFSGAKGALAEAWRSFEKMSGQPVFSPMREGLRVALLQAGADVELKRGNWRMASSLLQEVLPVAEKAAGADETIDGTHQLDGVFARLARCERLAGRPDGARGFEDRRVELWRGAGPRFGAGALAVARIRESRLLMEEGVRK